MKNDFPGNGTVPLARNSSLSIITVLLLTCLSCPAFGANAAQHDVRLPRKTVSITNSLNSAKTQSTTSTEYMITPGVVGNTQDWAQFGKSTTIQGDTALIGEPGKENASGTPIGVVFVYQKSGQTWQRTATIRPPSSASAASFGSSIAFNGTVAAIGAPGTAVAGNGGGAVFLYSYSPTSGTWTYSGELVDTNGNGGDGFGNIVAMSGNSLVVGSQAAQSVNVYSDNSGAWTKTATLAASNGTVNDGFGAAIAMSGHTIAVGAPNAGVPGNNLARGAAYVFSDNSGSWVQTQELTELNASSSDGFGSALAINGSNLIVGAPKADVNGAFFGGAAFLFTNSGGYWSQAVEFLPGAPSSTDEGFASSIDFNGSQLIIGAPGYGVAGIAYLYDDNNGAWTGVGAIYPPDTYAGAGFGGSVSVTPNSREFLIGAPDTVRSSFSYVGEAYFTTQADLDIAENSPTSIIAGNRFDARSIMTNNGNSISPPLYIGIVLPPEIIYWSATTQQGSCTSAGTDIVFCSISPIGANGGTASINVKISVPAGVTVGTALSTNAYILSTAPSVAATSVTDIKPGGTGNSGGGGTLGGPVLGAFLLILLAGIKRADLRTDLDG